MFVELSIVPWAAPCHWSDQLAEAPKLVDPSGLPYVLTPSGTCIDGEWDEVMTLVRRCHERVRRSSPHVLTSIRIEDEEGGRDQLTRNIASVEEKLGRPLRKLDPGGAGPIEAVSEGELSMDQLRVGADAAVEGAGCLPGIAVVGRPGSTAQSLHPGGRP